MIIGTFSNSEFAGVVLFCVVADQNVDKFADWIDDLANHSDFNYIFNFYLNHILFEYDQQNVIRRRLVDFDEFYYSFHLIKLLTINRLTDELDANKKPSGYQGIFINSPVVSGDIIILFSIIFGCMMLCAALYWCFNTDSCALQYDNEYVNV